MKLAYKHKGEITSLIDADYKNRKVKVQDFSSEYIDTAFGINRSPTFEDYEAFLESRCFPRERDHMKLHLEELGIDYYDPLSIIRRTQGRLSGDAYSLEIIEE